MINEESRSAKRVSKLNTFNSIAQSVRASSSLVANHALRPPTSRAHTHTAATHTPLPHPMSVSCFAAHTGCMCVWQQALPDLDEIRHVTALMSPKGGGIH
eukprot:72603-Chlamydomonas_euryale.AAC.1